MVNVYSVKKMIALILIPMLAVISFAVGIFFYNLIIALVILVCVLPIFVLIGNLLLKNPFSLMLEGKGILTIDFTSTGILRPFIVGVKPPFIYGIINKKPFKDIFNRKAVAQIAAPVKTEKILKKDEKKDKFTIELTEEDYMKSKFQMMHFPVVLYNSQVGSTITKEFLSDTESETFAQHHILFLNRLMEDLSTQIRDFARYIVDTTRPRGSIFSNKWVMGFVIFFLILMIALFAKPVLTTLMSFGSTAGGAMGGITTPINPLG